MAIGKNRLTLTIGDDLYNRLDVLAEQMGITKNSLAVTYIAQCIYNQTQSMDILKDLLKDKFDDDLKELK